MAEGQSFEDMAAEVQGTWEEAEVKEGGSGLLPDGWNGQARVVESRVQQADWGEWELYLKFEAMDGAGVVSSWDSLEQEQSLGIAKNKLVRLGMDEDVSLIAMRDWVESGEALDLVCDIKVKHKQGDSKTFVSVYVNRVHGKAVGEGGEAFVPAGAAAGDGDFPASSDDDIPF